MDKLQKVIVLVAMLCIAELMAIALLMGLDGTLLTLAVAAIAGLAGFTVPSDLLKRHK